MKEKIINFIFNLASKELYYNEIKDENKYNGVKKPDYSTKHTGFKKRPLH